jgi:RNA polymerase sigma-70 factor (ECF subfamily)
MAMDENELIRAAVLGDVDAFNVLVEVYQRRAYNLAYRLLGEVDAAADATQEAFISAFDHLDQYRGGSFGGWLMRIVTNTSYDERRRRKRRAESSLEAMTAEGEASAPRWVIQDEFGDPEAQAQQNALSSAIQDCLNTLNDDQRLIAILCDVQGYDYGEAAQIADAPIGTVKSRLSRARQLLRDCLQRIGELLPSVYRHRE